MRRTDPAARADDADVVGGEGLAQRARVKLVNLVVRQVGQTLVAIVIGLARLLEPVFELGRVGVNGNLHLVHDGAKVGVEAGVKDLAEMLQVKALIRAALERRIRQYRAGRCAVRPTRR